MNIEKKPTKSAIRKKIIDFLNKTAGQPDYNPGKYGCGMTHKNALVLATCHKNMPRATALEFFNEGLTLYILGGPGGKIANIKRNPRVSAFIYEQPLDHSVCQKSLQIFGKAELLTIRCNPRLFKAKLKKFNMTEVMTSLITPMAKEKNLSEKEEKAFIDRLIQAHSFIKILPDHIIMKEYPPNFTMQKYEWRR